MGPKLKTPSQAGLSLVELMVSIAIGMILTAGVIQVYISSKASYNLQEGMSRSQENGRFALAFMTQDLRMAGHAGPCSNLNETTINVIADADNDGTADFSFGNQDYLKGYDNGSGWSNDTGITRVPGTDVINLRYASTTDVRLTGNMGVVNANIQIDGNPENWQAGDTLVISDCENTDVFAASNVSSAAGKVTIAHANNRNISNNLSKAYDTSAFLMSYVDKTYFVGTNTNGDPALYVRDGDGTATELVRGIDDLQFQFGEDSAGALSGYEDADDVSDWGAVLSVRVDILTRSSEEASAEPFSYTFKGNHVTNPGDRRLRRWFNTVVAVMNRTL